MSWMKELLTSLIFLFVIDVSLRAETEKLMLNNEIVQVSVAMGGGGIVEFRFRHQDVNPLNWQMATDPEAVDSPRGLPRGSSGSRDGLRVAARPHEGAKNNAAR